MSNPYALLRGPLRIAIVQGLADGLSLGDVCGRPGMPSRSTVFKWARSDPAFAEEMRRARRLAHGRRIAFDEAVAAGFIARAAAGEPIRAILADPAMPSPALYRRWRAQQGHFAEALGRLQREHAASRRSGRAEARYRPFDRDTANRIYLKVVRGQALKAALRADPALPDYPTVTRWRRERRDFDALLKFASTRQRGLTQRALHGCTPEIIDAVFARVLMGASLAEIAGDRGMPSVHTLYAWKRDRPEFAEAVAAARAARLDVLWDQVDAATLDTPPEALREAWRSTAGLRKRAWYLERKAEQEAAETGDADEG